jgi:hypothetical protein
MSYAERIQQLLTERPGLKAHQIANELGLDRARVAAELQGLAGDDLVQDNTYRWWPKARPAPAEGAAPAPARTLLASICRYYLDCLSRESASGISIPASAVETDYVEIEGLPFGPSGAVSAVSGRTARRILRKVRQERGQLSLYIGYAVRLRPVVLRDFEEMRLEPVLLYPLEDSPGEDPPRPAGGIPLFNLDALKTLVAADSGSFVDEAIHLSDELGLSNPEEDLPEWDEILLRLERCRPEWDWRESLNPYALSGGTRLSELTQPGIYNRAILFAAPRSPFTYGLETELRKLAQLDEAGVAGTALGTWLRPERVDTAPVNERPLLEILPLNVEQRQAAVQGLAAPLTVVTGPPGTGKS